MQIHKDKVDLRLPVAGGGGGEMRNYCLMVTEFLFRCDGKVLEVDNGDVLCFLKKYLLIYLAAPGLGGSMWNLAP